MTGKPLIKRILAFGCSFTYGIGLEDCNDRPDKTDKTLRPSKLAWPALLHNLTGIPVVNRAIPAASNLEILWYLLDTKFEPGDVAIIMWSLPNRDVYFTKGPQVGYAGLMKPFQQLGMWATGDTARRWIVKMDEYDYQQRTWLYMHHAQLYLQSKQIPWMHFPAYPVETCVNKPDFLDITNLHMQGMAPVDKALDGEHPGPESQQLTSECIRDILRFSGLIN